MIGEHGGRIVLLVVALVGLGCTPGGDSARSTARSAAPTIVLRDVASECGLEFVHDNGARGEYHVPEIMGPGCALLDYDDDGDLDVYVAQGASLRTSGARISEPVATDRLFRNELVSPDRPRGSLRFVDVTSAAGVGHAGHGVGCATGDYDGDGHVDLYVTNYGPNVLYRNLGDGTFADTTAHAGVEDSRFSASAAFHDYDRDGDLDLFVTCYLQYSPTTSRECTRLGGQRDYCGPLSYEPDVDRLYRNEGDGTFVDVTDAAGIAVERAYGLGTVCADFDGDGSGDIFVANDATPNHLWIQVEPGRFENRALAAGVAVNGSGMNEAGMGVLCADLDRDGRDDFFLTHERGESNTLYRGLGGGLWADATTPARLAESGRPYAAFGVVAADFDNDGWLDLFVANGSVRVIGGQIGERHPYREPDQVYRGEDGCFALVETGVGGEPLAARGAAAGDLDLDGDVDVVVVSNSGPLRVLRNDSGRTRGGWVRLRPRQRRSPVDAYGSRVIARLPDGTSIHRRVGTDGGFASAGEPWIHLGIGAATVVETVIVEWAAGGRERWGPIAAGAALVLREGEGEAVSSIRAGAPAAR